MTTHPITQEATIEQVHEVYMRRLELPSDEVADLFDLKPSTMYTRFRRAGLPVRTAVVPTDQFTEEEIRRMHAGYLATRLHPWKYARTWHLNARTMYELFDSIRLAERRSRSNTRIVAARPADTCPFVNRDREFCPQCPCILPEGCTDWDCGSCASRLLRQCPCFNAELREAVNWEAELERWRARMSAQSKSASQAHQPSDNTYTHPASAVLAGAVSQSDHDELAAALRESWAY